MCMHIGDHVSKKPAAVSLFAFQFYKTVSVHAIVYNMYFSDIKFKTQNCLSDYYTTQAHANGDIHILMYAKLNWT